MDDTKEFLLHVMEENWRHARGSEEKRATLATSVILITSAFQLMLVHVGFTVQALPLTFTLILLGGYGIATTAKLYERSQYHILRARKLRGRLDDLCPDAHVQDLQGFAEEEHQQHYPLLMHIRLNTIWLTLHASVALLGVIYTVLIFFKI